MDALAVIGKAKELGISLRADGEYIYYRPEEAAPPEFVEMLRQYKADLLACLSRQSHAESGQGIPALLAWAAELSEQGRVLSDPVSYVEAPQRTVATQRVSWYASHYLRTITSARIGQQTGGWGMFNAQWHREREKEALLALAALREAMAGLPQEKGPDR